LIYLSEDLDKDINKIKTLTEKSRIETIILTKIEDYSLSRPEHEGIDNMLWLTELIGKYKPAPPDVDIDVEKDLETLLFSGGTTGLPKVAPRTHNSLLCSAEYAARAWEMESSDICLLAGPIGHDLTFTKGFCASIITLGAR